MRDPIPAEYWSDQFTEYDAPGELAVHRAHVSTSPSDCAVDLFYISGEIIKIN